MTCGKVYTCLLLLNIKKMQRKFVHTKLYATN